MISTYDREIQSLVEDVRNKRLLLPALQRAYVWKGPQVRDLFDSLYRNYPSGQLLVWATNDLAQVREAYLESEVGNGFKPTLLLDGQQRLTSLTAVMTGQALKVRDYKREIDIAFNVHTEKFEVAGPRQRGELGWISLKKFYQNNAFFILKDLNINMSDPDAQLIYERLARLDSIRHYRYRINVLENLSYDQVTHIFVRVNSGGTTLGSADLALAQASVRWRDITQSLEDFQKKQERHFKGGLSFSTGFLVRAFAVFLTGQSRPNYMFRGEYASIKENDLKKAWQRMTEGIETALKFLVTNCRIDVMHLLPTHYILIPLAAYFDRFHNITERQARDLQQWVYIALMWARYSGSSETALDQDISALAKENPIQILIQNVYDKVGNRPITERELRDQRKNSPFMLMSYVLARYASAADWFNGVQISGDQALELHHIFPKDVLRSKYDLRADSRTIDQVANLAFLTRRANVRISNSDPSDYLTKIDETRLFSQSVPRDSELWQTDKFEEFALARRQLLADGINGLVSSLSDNPTLWHVSDVDLLNNRIQEIEEEFRELVAMRLYEARGTSAWESLVHADIRRSVERRRDQHLQAHPYKAGKYDDLSGKLEFCQFSDYSRIIKQNWSMFEDVFGKTDQSFDQHISAVTAARNALAHNRSMSVTERALAEAGLVWLESCLDNALSKSVTTMD